MFIGKIHKGSGLGDQLFSYIATRVKAEKLGSGFGFVGKEFFKGGSFLNLDWGSEVEMDYHIEEPSGKLVIDSPHKLYELSVPYYDPVFNFLPLGTVIDGCYAQDLRYFQEYLPKINEWLAVEPLELPDNVCVINFRGGEFRYNSQLFLTKDYWESAIKRVEDRYLDRNSVPVFQVHTDDPETAYEFFPKYEIIHNIGLNWRSVRYAHQLILSNSAFGIIPALLNERVSVIAPKYWGRRNIQKWSMPQNYYPKFLYL